MITVHHLNHSRSQRVLWLLEELQLNYEIEHYERDPVTRLAPTALRAVHPLGKSPVLVDDGVIIAETGAIVDYLVEKTGGRLRPAAGTRERLRWTYWMHFAEGSLMAQLLLDLMLTTAPARVPEPLQAGARAAAEGVKRAYIGPNLKAMFDLVEAELGKSAWLAGDAFTAADVMMSFPLETGGARAGAFEGRPKLKDFVACIHARSAYQKALARGGPYAYA